MNGIKKKIFSKVESSDSWDVIDKAHDLMQQLIDEIKLEDI